MDVPSNKPIVEKRPCPECAKPTNCEIVKEYNTSWSEHGGQISGSNIFRIYQCRGCETVFFGSHNYFSEDFDYVQDPISREWDIIQNVRNAYFPEISPRSEPIWLNAAFSSEFPELFNLLQDIYIAVQHRCFALAAMGTRACFELTSKAIGTDQTLSFSCKIEAMRKGGHISPREKNLLSALVDAGSAAVHRGWTPGAEDIGLLLDTLEGFIQRVIVLPRGLDELTGRVPSRSF